MSDESILEDYEDYEDYTEDYASEDSGEDYNEDLGERVLRFRRQNQARVPRVARPRAYSAPRTATSQYVTRAELTTALGKVAADVKKNGDAIQSVGRRVSSAEDVNSRQGRELTKQNKINERQGKDITTVKKDLKKSNENALLMTILTQPKTLSATSKTDNVGDANVPIGTKLAIGSDNSLLLPLLLMGGLGGGSGDGGSSDMMMPLLLITMMK
jgi:hypothetical protein